MIYNINHIRKFQTENSCISDVFCKELSFFYHGLEDPVRDVKIKGITAFSEGVHELKINKTLTPLTKKYRAKYDWFKFFIEITGLTTHKSVYIHIGNKAEDSEGCLLLGMTRSKDFIGNSTVATKAFYEAVYNRLENGDRFFLHTENCF